MYRIVSYRIVTEKYIVYYWKEFFSIDLLLRFCCWRHFTWLGYFVTVKKRAIQWPMACTCRSKPPLNWRRIFWTHTAN